MIAHAGGKIDEYTYTNSLEAIRKSIELKFTHIELDVVKLKDDYGIAHDDHEQYYCLKSKFSDITAIEFKQLKYQNTYTTLLLSDLCKLAKNNNVYFILDIKCTTLLEYMDIINRIKYELHIIPQVYNLDEYKYLESISFPVCLFALWKKYDKHPYCDEVHNDLKYMCAGKVNLFGISNRHINPITHANNLEDIKQLTSYGKMVYIHDVQTNINTYDDILKLSLGIFCHTKPTI
jgi:glycerophosphoryl diester phosphodiesterase